MGAKNITLALQLLISLTAQAQQLSLLLQKAQNEGRDVTEEELNALVSDDEVAKAALDAAIARAKGAEG